MLIVGEAERVCEQGTLWELYVLRILFCCKHETALK